jgi:hypothetical protein
VVERPELEEFRRNVEALRKHALLSPRLVGDQIHLQSLTVADVAALLRDDAAYYFLIAAADLNRSSLKRAAGSADVAIVAPRMRRAHVVRGRLPVRQAFGEIANKAVALRGSDLARRSSGGIEALFRDRLKEEGIPILMSPPIRRVQGILVSGRKPDGVYPDPGTGQAPRIYLEVKNIKRVSDDIQKRLYEIAEASIEMKLLYGSLELKGLGLATMREALESQGAIRNHLRAAIMASPPMVVALFLCSRIEAERYRPGAEAFIDHVFFQEEVEECLDCLRSAIAGQAS